uniref:Uncharacterized protein n=1 Tax=Sorghum bicolor TaxID=4558 RepID=Q9XEP2_SORBI|nr:hypothetical protein [Sorghum bicolor]
MYTPYPDSESLKTLNGQATSDHACTLNFPIQLYQIQEPESRATTNVHRPLDRALLLAVTAAGVAMALHRRDVLVVHRGELRVAIPRRSDSVAPKHITEGEEDESKELEVGELLGALLRGARMAVDVAVGVTRAPGGEHGTVERERRLVEPEPLQRDEDARGEVHREARRQERAQDGGGDAERHEDDEEVVVVAFETHVRRGVEVEEHQLRRERRRRYQAECAVGQREHSNAKQSQTALATVLSSSKPATHLAPLRTCKVGIKEARGGRCPAPAAAVTDDRRRRRRTGRGGQTDRPGPELGGEGESAEEEEHEEHPAVLEVVEVRRVDFPAVDEDPESSSSRSGEEEVVVRTGFHARTRNVDGDAACRDAEHQTRHRPTSRNSVPGSTWPLNDPMVVRRPDGRMDRLVVD